MIKIKCLSEEKLAEIKKKWSGDITPLVCARVADTYTTNYDVQLSDAVLLIQSKFETSIYYPSSQLKLSELDFVSIEII